MRIVDEVDQEFYAAARSAPQRVEPVALLLTEAQESALRQEAWPSNWSYEPRKGVLTYNGVTVITVPEGVFYTPRVLMGDR